MPPADRPAPRRGSRGGLRLRLTLLATALLAPVAVLMLALTYLLVGRVVSALPRFADGTLVVVQGETLEAAAYSDRVVTQGREIVLVVGAIAFPLLLIAGGLVSWVLIGRALRPLSTLTTAARGLSESSLDRRIALDGPRDEVAELADTFDEMLARLQAAFEAERRFVANASHELRTPLSVIRTEVDVTLADPTTDEAELRRMAEVVREATDRADRLLTSLLVLARTQGSGVSERRPVDLSDLVRPAVRAVDAERIARGIEVGTDLEPAPVRGDQALLERIIGNLVENGVRHNVPGGDLHLQTGTAGTIAFVEVSSGGTLIDPAMVAQLFEPFRQGERARTGHRGSGLGLSIVRAVAAAHNGNARAQARPEGGLKVRVELPVDQAVARRAPSTAADR
ncbi:HAMP domain-containing protein [Nakamurella sp. YIM 132087]|uniref:histidine kinase n=1 Tax=Nakamurella alba TaxID=2665158 RepID=A0A7K1FQJ8_9ACTN|nr:HAMP domain-containing sensor histidine kinase [Nakamurella alba]MTD16425.1 HAMP domain-containing protein [Nakamurella alba]